MVAMSRRARTLAALRREPVDRVPCSPFFNPLSPQQRMEHRYQFPWGPSEMERIRYCVETLDLEPVVGATVGEHEPDGSVCSRVSFHGDRITKSWQTPAGELTAQVRYDERWPHGLDIPFFSDFNIGHFLEPWVKGERDVACLAHILMPPRSPAVLERLRFQFREARALASRYELAILSDVGMGLTGMQQLCGAENLCIMTLDNPAAVNAYLELEHRLNLWKIGFAAEMGADIIRRNGFYETADFYSPQALDTFLCAPLGAEIEAVHRGGMLACYTVHTGVMPILVNLAKLDFDCIMHIDVAFRGVDLARIRQQLGDAKSFWVGPSNTYHMWSADSKVVRAAVREVFRVLGPRGLIVTACPSSHSIMPWANSLAMIDECRSLGAGPIS